MSFFGFLFGIILLLFSVCVFVKLKMPFLNHLNKGILYQREASFRVTIMSCFSCCEDDDIHKAPESGNPFTVKHPAGNLIPPFLLKIKMEQVLKDSRVILQIMELFTCGIDSHSEFTSVGRS